MTTVVDINDIDQEALAAAAQVLGTSDAAATINAALEDIARRPVASPPSMSS